MSNNSALINAHRQKFVSTSPKHNRTKSRGPKISGSAGPVGQVRIIAGRLRGRKLTVPDVEGLRPTGDRVRETLFNWIQADIAGAHCLDLFAGSGALGFEALSRYARNVTFVEPNPTAFRNLGEICRLLEVPTIDSPALNVTIPDDNMPTAGISEDSHTNMQSQAQTLATTAHLYAGTAQAAIDQWVASVPVPLFDLVFIDPPFRMGCQWDMLSSLVPRLLKDNALVYIEAPTAQSIPDQLPLGCELTRTKRFGDVTGSLVRYAATR